MTSERFHSSADSPPNASFERLTGKHYRYQSELRMLRFNEARLRSSLAAKEAQLRLKDELLRQQDLLSREAAHRLSNDLQLVQSLLRLQIRRAANAETASELTVAANRLAAVGRIHELLHSFGATQAIAFKEYLEKLCRDFSAMLSSEDRPEQVIAIEGCEVELPCATGVSLAFIANELITNAVKHGKGRITVRLEPDSERGYAFSVCNAGPPLPEGFDPCASKGLGMKIVRSLVNRIGGELRFGRGESNQDTQFTVLFS